MGGEISYEESDGDLAKVDSQVVGIVTSKGNAVVADAATLVCDGIEANPVLNQTHTGPEWDNAKVRNTAYNTGDVLVMAKKVPV
ncbi:MAG: hypothetical protein ABJI96_02575 [Paracoccaceae bacterium]